MTGQNYNRRPVDKDKWFWSLIALAMSAIFFYIVTMQYQYMI